MAFSITCELFIDIVWCLFLRTPSQQLISFLTRTATKNIARPTYYYYSTNKIHIRRRKQQGTRIKEHERVARADGKGREGQCGH